MMNVKKEIKPCHIPIQNPAASSLNFSLPGAHEVRMIARAIKPRKGRRRNFFFIVLKCVGDLNKFRDNHVIALKKNHFYI